MKLYGAEVLIRLRKEGCKKLRKNMVYGTIGSDDTEKSYAGKTGPKPLIHLNRRRTLQMEW